MKLFRIPRLFEIEMTTKVASGPTLVRAAYGANYARLVEVKKKYDPHECARGAETLPQDNFTRQPVACQSTL
jgi:hypothetical protein